MQFSIIKSSLDGISHSTQYACIADVLREISFYRGWDSPEQLHDAIRKWAGGAKPGDVFTTQVTAIVAVASASRVDRVEDQCPWCFHDGLEYEELDVTEDANVEQEVTCPECGRRWRDVFVLAERRQLASVAS